MTFKLCLGHLQIISSTETITAWTLCNTAMSCHIGHCLGSMPPPSRVLHGHPMLDSCMLAIRWCCLLAGYCSFARLTCCEPHECGHHACSRWQRGIDKHARQSSSRQSKSCSARWTPRSCPTPSWRCSRTWT